jgi:outer membrane protein OmpA-like peptidoglycan-associated protein
MRSSTRRVIGPVAGLIGMILAALVLGCAAPPSEHATLDQARAAVERARGAPRVRALAAVELDRAEVTLQRADAAAASGAPASHVDHLAYAARRQAALAEAHAADRVARSEVEVLQRALDQLLAAARADLRPDRADGDAAPVARIKALPDLTLSLSELPFDDAEPGEQTASRLDEVADRLRGEPARGLSIEADFDLPDPVARTLMERRIEAVRAALLRRGIDPSRISVRSGAPDRERTVTSFERLAP